MNGCGQLSCAVTGVALFFALPASAAELQPLKFMQQSSCSPPFPPPSRSWTDAMRNSSSARMPARMPMARCSSSPATCPNLPNESGVAQAVTVKIEFEKGDDGGVGEPLGFVYD